MHLLRAADGEDRRGRDGEGGVEYDVEHYSQERGEAVADGARSSGTGDEGVRGEGARGRAAGYAGLAFDPTNYAVSCKLCNSGQKANFFPDRGKGERGQGARAAARAVERRSIRPRSRSCGWRSGATRPDPADVLLFVGAAVQPRRAGGHAFLVGRVTIDFFDLDVRADLVRQRAMTVALLYPRLRAGKEHASVRPEQRLSGCARDFVALYARDRRAARRAYNAAQAYVASADPGL